MENFHHYYGFVSGGFNSSILCRRIGKVTNTELDMEYEMKAAGQQGGIVQGVKMNCLPAKLTVLFAAVFGLGMLCPGLAIAASFDCAKASTKVEKMICGSAELSRLDEELGRACADALEKASDPSALRQGQREWLKERNLCGDTACLKEQYQQRLACLSKSPPDFTTIYPPDISEFDVDCGKALSIVDKIICQQDGDHFESLVAKVHKEMLNTLQWTLMRSKDKEAVIDSQRRWMSQVRDACADGLCLAQAYPKRTGELLTMQARPNECYVLQPILDGNGKVEPIEAVCQALEQNLNQFCDQPPMVCGLKVAPEFCQQITFPNWTPLEPQAHRAFIKELLMTPREVRSKQSGLLEEIWKEEKAKIDYAFDKKIITFAKGELDLFNIGILQPAYRLDYGTCFFDNKRLKDQQLWNTPLKAAPVKIQLEPESISFLFKKYFPMEQSPASEVFLYGGQVFSYMMFGYSAEGAGEAENWLDVYRREKWSNSVDGEVNLHRAWVCRFEYNSKGVDK